jgi:hypothetical protein
MTHRLIGRLVALTLGLLVVPLAAEAQPPTHVHRIGALSGLGTTPGRDPFVEAFLEGMRARSAMSKASTSSWSTARRPGSTSGSLPSRPSWSSSSRMSS